jgi:hypothetical protein
MKPKWIFKKENIESITRRNAKGSYGKLVDIIYKGLCYTFHGDHCTAVESDNGEELIVERIFV